MLYLKTILSPLRAGYLPIVFLIIAGGCAPSSEQAAAGRETTTTRKSNIIWPATKRYEETVKKLPITPARAREILLAYLGRDKVAAKVTTTTMTATTTKDRKEVNADHHAGAEADHHADGKKVKAAKDDGDAKPSSTDSEQPDTLIPTTPSAIIAGQYFFGISGEDHESMSGYLVDGKTGAIKYRQTQRLTAPRRNSSWRWQAAYRTYYPSYPYYPYAYGYDYDFDDFSFGSYCGYH